VSWRRSPAVLLAALTGLNLVNYVDRYMLGAVLPFITADFHLSGLQGGLLGMIYVVVFMVVAPVAGWLADHRPRLHLAGIGVLIWTVATVSSGLAPAFMILLLARAASGVGEATYTIVTPSLLSDAYPAEKRGTALAIFYAAYLSEIFRSALVGVHAAQREAAQALGLNRWSTFAHVVFPQALRLALPGTTTMLVDLLKSTSLLTVIAAGELMAVGNSVASQTFEQMEVFLVIGAIYFALCYPLSQALLWLERRVRAGTQHRITQRGWIRVFGGREDAHIRTRTRIDLDGGQVDAIPRGPGHHPDGYHRSILMRMAPIPLRAPRCGSGTLRRRCRGRSTRGSSAAPPSGPAADRSRATFR